MRAASAAFRASGFSHAIAFSFAPCLIAATMRSMFSTRAKFGPHSQMQSIDSSATIDSIDPNAFASPTRSDRTSAAASSALARVGL